MLRYNYKVTDYITYMVWTKWLPTSNMIKYWSDIFIPWKSICQPIPVLFPGKSHGQRFLVGERNGYPLQYSYLENSMERSLGGYSSCGHNKSDMTEWLTFSLHSCFTWKYTWQDYGKKFWHWPPYQCPRNKSEEIGSWACIALLPICLWCFCIAFSQISMCPWLVEGRKTTNESIMCSAKT